MEIQKNQMEHLAILANLGGKNLIKNLTNVERKTLNVVLEALCNDQKVDVKENRYTELTEKMCANLGVKDKAKSSNFIRLCKFILNKLPGRVSSAAVFDNVNKLSSMVKLPGNAEKLKEELGALSGIREQVENLYKSKSSDEIKSLSEEDKELLEKLYEDIKAKASGSNQILPYEKIKSFSRQMDALGNLYLKIRFLPNELTVTTLKDFKNKCFEMCDTLTDLAKQRCEIAKLLNEVRSPDLYNPKPATISKLHEEVKLQPQQQFSIKNQVEDKQNSTYAMVIAALKAPDKQNPTRDTPLEYLVKLEEAENLLGKLEDHPEIENLKDEVRTQRNRAFEAVFNNRNEPYLYVGRFLECYSSPQKVQLSPKTKEELTAFLNDKGYDVIDSNQKKVFRDSDGLSDTQYFFKIQQKQSPVQQKQSPGWLDSIKYWVGY